MQVIIEVDGPTHFSVNSRRPLGRTVARKLMIEARGYVVRSIPYYEWCALESVDQQQAYVWRLLASAIPQPAQLDIPVQVRSPFLAQPRTRAPSFGKGLEPYLSADMLTLLSAAVPERSLQ